jgi:DNA polymerase-3 subunit epsilon
MLSQVREVSCAETATALEAALLETDEIKRFEPPYNRALTAAGRSLWFATTDLRELRPMPDDEHTIGPLGSPLPFAALAALRDALVAPAPVSLAVRARALGLEPAWAPEAECFAAGCVLFAAAHGRLATARQVIRVGGSLWATRRAADATVPEAAGEDEPPAPRRRLEWDAARVRGALEEVVLRAAHAVRRARWLLRLSESSLAWSEPGRDGRRLLVIERGRVAVSADHDPHSAVPAPRGASLPPAERRAAFDVPGFDRLRVLTTELRPLVAGAAPLELRLGAHARLSRHRLEAVLRWV